MGTPLYSQGVASTCGIHDTQNRSGDRAFEQLVGLMVPDVPHRPALAASGDGQHGGEHDSAYPSTALPNRVTSILSASYADSDIRDALGLLDARGLEDTASLRRQLRLDVQEEVIESNGAIIHEFGIVAEQLRRIGATIATLNQGNEEMKQRITAARLETAPVLEEASDLINQKEQVEVKQQLLDAFTAHFVMSDSDVVTLTSNSEPVDDKFFTLLARAKSIQDDCRVLLGGENQRLGLEILEHMTKTVNQAFQKMHRWIQRELKSLDLENPQINMPIRRALTVLAERPTLFQNCLDIFAEDREQTLSDLFMTALTGLSADGSEETSVKPFELMAHDPLRYVGDILAWVHATAVGEREALESLFVSEGDATAKGIQAGRASEPWNPVSSDNAPFDGRKALHDLVDRDLTAVVKILRQRIGQVVQSHEEVTMAYKLANVLQFYRFTFAKILSEDSVLLETLDTLEGSALKQFRSLVRDQVAALHGDPVAVAMDLSPPEFLQDALKQLTIIMKTYETSLATPQSQASGFEMVLAEAFDPFMTHCVDMAHRLTMPDSAIFLLNCLMTARSMLAPYDFTESRLERTSESIDGAGADLITFQSQSLRSRSGLQQVFEAVEAAQQTNLSPDELRKHDALQPDALKRASQSLDQFLPSALMDTMENLKNLQSTRLASEITEEAAAQFCDAYELLEESLTALDADGTSSPAVRSLFPRDGQDIRVLLA